MKPVIQQEQTGCGIAAVATFAGVTYRDAQRVGRALGILAADATLWSSTGPVRRLLRQHGIATSPGEQPFVSWDRLPSKALLAIKWRRQRGQASWHWVVFWRGPQGAVVFDSKASLRSPVRRDFGRMKPKWFIRVR